MPRCPSQIHHVLTPGISTSRGVFLSRPSTPRSYTNLLYHPTTLTLPHILSSHSQHKMSTLFTLPIAKCGAHPGGTLTCTEPSPRVYLLTLLSPPDNRLTTPVLKAFLNALDIIEFGYPHGVVATTSGIPKFYSNGLDLEHAVATDGFWPLLYDVWARFLTYVYDNTEYL
jgi:hypothetical protein